MGEWGRECYTENKCLLPERHTMTDLLQRFAEKTDRQAPPHFVGRAEIMDEIKRDLHN